MQLTKVLKKVIPQGGALAVDNINATIEEWMNDHRNRMDTLQRTRTKDFKDDMREKIKAKDKTIHKWIRNGTYKSIQTVDSPTGVKSDPYEILRTFESAWSAIYNTHTDEGALLEGLYEAAHLVAIDMNIPDLDGNMFYRRLKKVKLNSATGQDEISTSDLLELPPIFWDKLADIFNRGKW